MTVVEILLLVIGCIFMIGSFFVTEKLSQSELNKVAELSEDQLKHIIDKEMENAGDRIQEAIDDRLDASSDDIDRAMQRETNEKIMAISEYSDTVIETMNKTHNEIVFLYNMLNDKHAEMTEMLSDMQHLAADMRSLEESRASRFPTVRQAPKRPDMRQQVQMNAAQGSRPVRTAAPQGQAGAARQMTQPSQQRAAMPRQVAQGGSGSQASGMASSQGAGATMGGDPLESMAGPSALATYAVSAKKDNHNQEILLLHKKGMSEVDIAKKLGLGIGEVRLVIGLYRGDLNS